MATLSPAPQMHVAPVAKPITLAEAKAHCRVDHTDDDALIDALIDSAVAYLDGWGGVLGRAIMPQQWRQEFGGWGDLPLALPDVASDPAPVVEGFDSADAAVAATVSDLVKTAGGWILVTDGPAVARVRVTYTCGLPAVRLPAARALVKLMVGYWYGNRGDAAGAALAGDIPPEAAGLMRALRVVRI